MDGIVWGEEVVLEGIKYYYGDSSNEEARKQAEKR